MSEPTKAVGDSAPKQLPAADAALRNGDSVTGLTLEHANPVQMFVSLVLRRRPLRSLLLILTGGAGIGLMGFEPLLLKQLFDLLQSQSSAAATAQRDEALQLFGWIGAVWLASFAMNRLREWIEVYTAPEVRQEIQEFLLQWAMGHSAGFFRQRFAGALAQSIKQAGTAMAVLVSLLFNDFVRLIVTTGLTILLAARLEGGFVWAMAAWMLGYYTLCLWFARKTAPMFKRFTTAGAKSTGTLVDILTNMDLVRSFATQRREQAVASADLSVERETSQENRRYIVFMNAILQGGVLLFQIGFIAYAIHLFGLGLLTLGDVALMISLAAIVVANVNGLCGQLLNFFEQLGSLSSALTSILQPHDIHENKNALSLNAHSGAIRFERVSFGYHDGQPVLQALDLEIRPGEKVGLVGPSGSGKSTLLKLLTRQYNVSGGRILIDGQDIAQVTLASLNLAVAEIPQDSTMFHRSLRDNIAYASSAIDDEQLVTAIEQSQSRAFIDERAEGLAAVVGERGTHLSGGERQRIAVARAILKDAPILVMDEATSALDSHTETLITAAIARVIEGRTVIAIAHRLSTLTAMDRIVYLQNGAIVEQGSHTELLAKEGCYARMWRQQSSGFITH
jgi:ATP-binding cassette subfamily B protein